MQKPKIFGYILRFWHMVPKIHGTAVSIKTRKTKKSARTNSKVKPSNQEFKRQNKDRSTSYIYSHSSSSSRSFSTSDDDDDDHHHHHHHHPYFPPRMDHRVYDNLYAPRIVDYYDDDEPYIPPLMKRNEADAPYIRPLSDYGDQIFHTSDDDDDDDDDDDPYFTPRTHHEDFEDLYVPPLMKHNNAGDPYIRRPLVDYRDNNFQISNDQKYAEQLQLEELIFSSASHASTSSSSSKPPIVSSKLPERYCNICTDIKTESEMFRNTNVCGHMYCFDCIREYIAVKIKENMANVTCPDPSCKGLIRPEVCRFIVPSEVLIRWENALCESMILGSQKFYCPFKDCSALLVDDGRQRVTSAECLHCNRLFCAQCKVAWHAGMDCREFKMVRNGEIDQTDILIMNLAKTKEWKRCPKCSFYVEKTEGCNHITCRCRYQFCYACGMKYHEGPCSEFCYACGMKNHEGPCQPASPRMIPPARMVRPARMITLARRIRPARMIL